MRFPGFQSLQSLAIQLTSFALLVSPAQAGEPTQRPLKGIQTEMHFLKKLATKLPADKESQPTLLDRVLEGQELLNAAWVWLLTVPLLPEYDAETAGDMSL